MRWLKSVLTWATRTRLDSELVLRENPIRHYTPKKEENVKRPVATTDRYEALMKVADRVFMEIRWHGKREKRLSYFGELLTLAYHTGKRISAICQLRYEDLRLKEGPFGSIRWPGDTDKEGKEWNAPLNAEARKAIDAIMADRPGVGQGCLFPSPMKPTKPVSRHLAKDWLLRAEDLASLDHLPQGGWHSYRRAWATMRKHLPDVDVAQAGGWKTVETLKLAYQHTDEATLINVVMGGKELREAK